MKRPRNRLSDSPDHRFAGTEIDRTKSFTFRLDGQEIEAFAGDTLLTAAIAAGVIGAGRHEGHPLALDERFAPPVLLRGDMGDPSRALPMARAPAAEGLDLLTLPQARRHKYHRRANSLRLLLPSRRTSMALGYDDDASLVVPWFDAGGTQPIDADLAIIGGGLAGLAAAQAAGKRGERVVLIERRQWLGGDARFFGSIGEEQSPDEMVDGLVTALKSLPNVTILLRAEAFALYEGSVRVNRVTVTDGIPASDTLTVNAPRIVAANGSLDRLPIFAGNRLPGVVGAVTAFNRADRYGVWIGRRSILTTATSVAYRVAIQAKNAGIALERIADMRLDPQSRFIEFSKAYSIPLARDLKPRDATLAGRRAGLVVLMDHNDSASVREPERFEIDQLLVSGGWQPDLTLWHMAGGSSRWHHPSQQLRGEGGLPGIALAGSVAGYLNASAVIASGRAAVAQLYGRSHADIADEQIDPVHETPDAGTPLGAFETAAEAPAYLDGGASLALRPAPPRKDWLSRWRAAQLGGKDFADQARALGVADVVAGVLVGAIPPADAAVVAQERCVTPGDVAADNAAPGAARVAAAGAAKPPAYLAGRFGPKISVWVLEAKDSRTFEIGNLVYLNADMAAPAAAMGVVFAPAPAGRSGGLAVIGRWPGAEGDVLFVRDMSGAVPTTLVDPLKPVEMPVVVAPIHVEEVAAPLPVAAPEIPQTTESALALLAGTPAHAPSPAPQLPTAAAETAPTAIQVPEPAVPEEAVEAHPEPQPAPDISGGVIGEPERLTDDEVVAAPRD